VASDYELTRTAFVARVTGDLAARKAERKSAEMASRPEASVKGVAAYWGMTKKEVVRALKEVPADDRQATLVMLAGVPRRSTDGFDSARQHLTDWRRGAQDWEDEMQPTRMEARPLRKRRVPPTWAADGVPIAALFTPGKRFLSKSGAMIDGGAMLLEKIEGMTAWCKADGDYAYARPGKKSRGASRVRAPRFSFPESEEDLSFLGRNFHWDISSPACCRELDVSDVPLRVLKAQKVYRGPVLDTVYIGRRLPKWVDEQILQDAEYGLSFETELGHGVVVQEMNKSARPHLRSLWEGIVKQERDGEVMMCQNVQVFPSCYYPFGASSPNWREKWRLTSDLRIHDPVSPWEGSMSRNDNCAKEDYVVPRWVRLRSLLKESADMYSFWNELAEAHPDCRETLRPWGWGEDGKSYFHRFGMRRVSRGDQGCLIPQPDGLSPAFVSSNVLLFGSVPGPYWAQRFSCVLVALVRRRLWEFELQLLKEKDAGCEVASRHLPEGLASIVRAKAAEEGGGIGKLPHWATSQYIDDLIGRTLGPLRAMVGLIHTWQEFKAAGTPVGENKDGSSAKAQLGELTEVLGVDAAWGKGVAKVTDDKRYVLDRWIRRVRQRSWVAFEEFESLWGTIESVASFLPGVRRELCCRSSDYYSLT